MLFAFIFPLPTNPVFAQAKIDARTEIIRDEINKKKKEVEAFDPTTNSKFVERGFKDWVLFSVSKRARREYYEQDKFTPAQQDVLDPAFDSLGEAVSGRLALYKPRPDTSLFEAQRMKH